MKALITIATIIACQSLSAQEYTKGSTVLWQHDQGIAEAFVLKYGDDPNSLSDSAVLSDVNALKGLAESKGRQGYALNVLDSLGLSFGDKKCFSVVAAYFKNDATYGESLDSGVTCAEIAPKLETPKMIGVEIL